MNGNNFISKEEVTADTFRGKLGRVVISGDAEADDVGLIGEHSNMELVQIAHYTQATQGLAADLSCSAGAKRLFAMITDLKVRGKLPDLEYAILYIAKDFVHIDCGKKRSIFFEVRS